MRPTTIIAAAAASLMLAGAASAAEIGPVSDIRISFGKDVESKNRIIGAPEKERLAAELRGEIERAIGGLTAGGGVLELVIEDVKPNRPTMTQLRFQPGISYVHSFGIGGATIEGAYVAADGERTPLRYSWYESDIRNARAVPEWYDADRTFARFARKLAEG